MVQVVFPTIYRVSAPSKRWLGMGFQPSTVGREKGILIFFVDFLSAAKMFVFDDLQFVHCFFPFFFGVGACHEGISFGDCRNFV